MTDPEGYPDSTMANLRPGLELTDRHWYRGVKPGAVRDHLLWPMKKPVGEMKPTHTPTQADQEMETLIFEAIIQSPHPAMPESSTSKNQQFP